MHKAPTRREIAGASTVCPRSWLVALALGLALAAAWPALAQNDGGDETSPVQFWVALFGSTQTTWSNCTQSNPFLTLDQARLQVRAYRAANPGIRDIIVNIAGGEYSLSAPVVFTVLDAGWPGHPIRYVAWNPNRPGMNDDNDVFFTGGVRLTGWTPSALPPVPPPSGTTPWTVWRCTVPAGIEPRDLWVNNYRLIRARFPNIPDQTALLACTPPNWNSPSEPPCPNLGFLIVESVLANTPYGTQDVVIKNGPETNYVFPAAIDWFNVEAVAHNLWVSPRQRTGANSGVIGGNRANLRFGITPWPNPVGAMQDMGAFGVYDLSGTNQHFHHGFLQVRSAAPPYLATQVYLENAEAFLDLPYEWSYDRRTSSRELHLALCADPDTAGVNVVAPVAPQLLVLDRTSDLSFEGLDWGFTRYSPRLADNTTFGYTTVQSGMEWLNRATSFQIKTPLTPAVDLLGCSRCTFYACKIAHTGGSAISIGTYENTAAGEYLESHENLLARCEFFDLNGHGVWLGDQFAQNDDWGAAEPYQPSYANAVMDCKIHRFGVVYKDAVGINIAHSRGPIIEHNEIAYGNWSGISTGTFQRQEWLESGPACTVIWQRNNEAVWIAYNHIHDTNLKLTDGGGIYGQGTHASWNGADSTIHGNYVHDVIVNPFLNGTSHVKGMQFDAGSSGWLITRNYVARAFKLFQFNTGGTATLPADPVFGKAVWPVNYTHLCDDHTLSYDLDGMLWAGGTLGNRWLVPGSGGSGPYGAWEECWGYPAMPNGQNENKQITVEDAQTQAIREEAGPQVSFPPWNGGSERIYRGYPASSCGESASEPPEDPF